MGVGEDTLIKKLGTKAIQSADLFGQLGGRTRGEESIIGYLGKNGDEIDPITNPDDADR